MACNGKENNKNSTFQARLREQHSKKSRTLDELATIFGATRQTVSKWMTGESVPDIIALAKIAEFYNVSTDYLLGFSNTTSIDVNVKASMEYTGLSEEAVEWLHIGLDDFECDGAGISDTAKKQNLKTASILIKDRAFTQMIHHLQEVSLEAYLERVLWILDSEYSECGSDEDDPEFRYAKKEDRDLVVANLIHVLQEKCLWEKEKAVQYVMALDNDDKLAGDVMNAYEDAKESNELHQFHAAKAFTSYIDQLVEASYSRARRRIERNI